MCVCVCVCVCVCACECACERVVVYGTSRGPNVSTRIVKPEIVYIVGYLGLGHRKYQYKINRSQWKVPTIARLCVCQVHMDGNKLTVCVCEGDRVCDGDDRRLNH